MLATFQIESISLGIKINSFGEVIKIAKSLITNSQRFTRQRKYILYYFYYVIHYFFISLFISLFHCLFSKYQRPNVNLY